MEKYSVFLGSEVAKTYDSAKEFTFDRVASYSDFNYLELKETLECIDMFKGHVFWLIDSLRDYHDALASKCLLKDNNISEFKENSFISGFLRILSKYPSDNIGFFLLSLLSDSQELHKYFIYHCNEIFDISAGYRRNDTRAFFRANTFLALTGDWELLKERSLIFLNDEKKASCNLKHIPDHEFYVALADKDIDGMKNALAKLLDLKLAKRASREALLHFDFYLQPQVLLYAKIAMIHGFDLGIDSPIAPKELIEINPLPEYKIPYDFMKLFNFDEPHQVWVEFINQKMAERTQQEESKQKKGFWASLFSR